MCRACVKAVRVCDFELCVCLRRLCVSDKNMSVHGLCFARECVCDIGQLSQK